MTCETIEPVPASAVAEELIASIPDGAPPEPAAPIPEFGIEVNGKQFAECVKSIAKIIPRWTARPELKCILISVSGDSVTMTADNLDYRVSRTIPAEVVRGDGAACLVDAAHLVAFAKGIRKVDSIGIGLDRSGRLTMVNGGSSSTVGAETDLSDFPAAPEMGESVAEYRTGSAQLAERIKCVSIATADTAARWATNGIEIRLSAGGESALAATDTRRLAWSGPLMSAPTFREILPADTLDRFSESAPAEDAETSITFGKDRFRIQTRGLEIHSRYVEGRFPPYTEIIPKTAAARLSLSAREFADAIKAGARSCNNDGNEGITLRFGESFIEISSENPNGKSESRVMFSNPDGEWIGQEGEFNPKFLLEYLALCGKKESVRLEFNGPDKPATLKGEHTPATYLVMPMCS